LAKARAGPLQIFGKRIRRPFERILADAFKLIATSKTASERQAGFSAGFELVTYRLQIGSALK
jgi:hypothetical protein